MSEICGRAHRRRRAVCLALLIAGWIAAVWAGLSFQAGYSLAEGQRNPAPQAWPTSSQIERTLGRATLVVFLHPYCPCSRATLTELHAALSAKQSAPVDVHLQVVQPATASQGWGAEALQTLAEAVPSAEVRLDRTGMEAIRFGAATSGHAVYYDQHGVLQFAGGITASRGQQGENAGRAALCALIRGGTQQVGTFPVYGCPLRNSGLNCEEGRCGLKK